MKRGLFFKYIVLFVGLVSGVLVINSAANSVLSIRNPTGNSTALTVTPSAGGTQAVSASLLIKQLQ